MINVTDLSKLYAEKLLATGDHQEAFLKAVWVAYKQGIKDATDVDAGLLQATEPSEVTPRGAGGLDREQRATQLHSEVCTQLPEVGDTPRAGSDTQALQAQDATHEGEAQCGSRHPVKPPGRVRFDRATKLTVYT